jgi:prepilin-type N-terminal cleavage/methylation domain-containing protein
MVQMKKLNNKGFSLVELIIVIAIMAILVGVVGTQVIPYLESSRKAKDEQIFSAWNTAAVSAYSMEAGNLNATATYTIVATITGTGSTKSAAFSETSGALNGDKLLAKFEELCNITGHTKSMTLASKAGQGLTTVTMTINGNNGSVTTTYNPATNFDTITNE